MYCLSRVLWRPYSWSISKCRLSSVGIACRLLSIRSHSSLSEPPIQFSFVPPKLPVELEQHSHLLIEYNLFNDIQRSMMGLYHSLSEYFHSQQAFENIVIDARLLAPSKQFVAGTLFKRFNIPSIYIDKEGNMAMFPYNLKDISSDQ
ncbi:unnamed protein product [Rotaria magnacalcarata]|uniref:Uncharacterized protein n=1 Tax=Rotaria magnacalcarata TaxID=392030 RepID=A0A816PCU4_9BILA|nr:unnamed protein product [Rotaria magnacalcarata]